MTPNSSIGIGFQSMGHRPEEYGQADRVIYSLAELDPISILSK